MFNRYFAPAILAAGLAGAAASAQPELHFDDLRRFDQALSEIESGADPEAAIAGYVSEASPGFHGFAGRYQTTSESIAEQYRRRPVYYGGLSELEHYIASRQGEIDTALSRLTAMAPAGEPVDTYFFVADQKAGGTPTQIATAAGPGMAIAVAVDMIAISPQTDMSEFPGGTGGRAGMSDLPQVVVHENAHVLQLASQGGLENYLSIYSPDGGSMLAVAVREGCAEYLTYLASGWRLGDRHIYGARNEAALWREFREVADAPPFSVPGWFGGRHETHTDYPPQIGYWVGFQVCQHHHRSAADPEAALRDLFTTYAPADVAAMAAAYEASLGLD